MSKTAKTFKELVVWQKAHEFVLAVYHLTAKFPTVEIYCLTTQARRAAISIAANIAEGFKKRGWNDKTRFFNIAQGSLEECRYYLILAQDLGYADTSRLEIFLEEVADARIQAAYQTLADAQLPITPAKLATRALTGYPTALRWLKIHHPELLVPKPPKPEAVPTEEGPKTTTHAQSSQKQPQAAPRKRGGTPKAQKLPKPLRNPKNHPELLAGGLDPPNRP
jgi:four helix bundle protein